MKTVWTVAFGIVIALLSAGLIFYLVQTPRGEAVVLRPPPTPLPIKVHVSGGVLTPGVYVLPVGSRALDAVEAAGGFLAEADPSGLNLAKLLEDGEHLIVPTMINDAELPMDQSLSPQTSSQDTKSSSLININTATQIELETLPGIGPVLAQEIIVYRDSNGPFQSEQEIIEVKGIGPAKYDRIKDMITVEDFPL